MSGISISPKKLDLLLVAAQAAGCALLATRFHPPIIVTAAYMFVPPVVYLALRARKQLGRDLLGAVLLGPVFGFMVEILGWTNNLWTYHDRWFFIPARLFGTPVDILVWCFLWALYLGFLYEHFFEPAGPRGVSKLYLPMLLFALAGIGYMLLYPALFKITNAYLVMGLFLLWPVAAALYWRRALVWSVVPAAALGLILNVAFEWASCTAGYWTFGAHYLGVVALGGCTLPVEEILFWVLVSPLVVLCNFLLFVKRA